MGYVHKNNIRILTAFAVMVAVIIVLTAVFGCAPYAGVSALASETAEGNDTFSVVFPLNSYFQSNDPTLIAANDSYLLIYDKTERALFVRSNAVEGTTVYKLPDFDNVLNVFAVGNTAFINIENKNPDSAETPDAPDTPKYKYYTIDLRNAETVPVERTLEKPSKITYFNSDGKYLYAKSTAGNISIYDENLEIAFGVDDISVDRLAGNPVLAGKDGKIYVFYVDLGYPKYIVCDPAPDGNSTSPIEMQYNVTNAFIGDVIFAKVRVSETEFKIVGIDKNSVDLDNKAKILFSTDIQPDSFYAYGNKLFSIEGKRIVIYTLKDDLSGLEATNTISMAGSDLEHLDSPEDVVKIGGKLVVADRGNNRICFIDSTAKMRTLSFDSEKAENGNPVTPLRLASNGSNAFALLNNGTVVQCNEKGVVSRYEMDGVIDIAYLDKLYLLTDDGIYTVIANVIIKLADVSGAKRIACADEGSNIYVLKDDRIEIYAGSGIPYATSLLGNFSEAKDLSVDYAGNITVLLANGFKTYKNNITSLSLTKETVFTSTAIRATASSFCVSGTSLYFTADECFIGKSFVEAVSKENFAEQEFVPNLNSSYSFMRLKENVSSTVYYANGRIEELRSAPNDTMLVLNGEGPSSGKKYALLEGVFYVINVSDYDVVEEQVLSGDYIAIRDTVLYALPGVASGKIEVKQGTRFMLVSDCADFEGGKWLRVKYDNKIYFVEKNDSGEYVKVVPKEERLYGRAKATRVGGLVNIYTNSNAEAASIMQIVDGDKVEILEEVDGYYRVCYGEEGAEIVGYMLKDEVKIGGLTTVQIISIVLAIFVAAVGIGVFIAVEYSRKKANEKPKKENE